jgi:hypothetical protein
MKFFALALAVYCVAVAGIAYATQTTALTQRQVRDPRKLEAILEANATDAETRLAAAEAKSSVTDGSFAIINTTNLVFICTSTNGVAISPSVTNVIDVNILSP